MCIATVCILMLSFGRTLFPQSPTAAADPATQSAVFDIVIVNGHIIDGTGSPWYSGQVGIRAGRIAAIGNLSAAPRRQTIDAMDKVVAPGFIDMLGQSELTMLVDPR
jgi:dihydroorotase/N-acyl-D-amino-acid deacylase